MGAGVDPLTFSRTTSSYQIPELATRQYEGCKVLIRRCSIVRFIVLSKRVRLLSSCVMRAQMVGMKILCSMLEPLGKVPCMDPDSLWYVVVLVVHEEETDDEEDQVAIREQPEMSERQEIH